MDGNKEVLKIVLGCFVLMCNDKCKGKEVVNVLDFYVFVDSVGFWDILVDNIWNDDVDYEIL